MKKPLETNNDASLTLMRVILGSVFFAHGAQKVLGWFGGYGFQGTLQGMSKTLPVGIVLLVMAAEFLGSIGLIFGLLTRIAAFGVAAVMIGAILTVHMPNGFFMNWMGNQPGEGFEYHLLVLALTITLMWRGAGAYSIDGWLAHMRPAPSRQVPAH